MVVAESRVTTERPTNGSASGRACGTDFTSTWSFPSRTTSNQTTTLKYFGVIITYGSVAFSSRVKRGLARVFGLLPITSKLDVAAPIDRHDPRTAPSIANLQKHPPTQSRRKSFAHGISSRKHESNSHNKIHLLHPARLALAAAEGVNESQ